ncbi:tyrosine-type recombinase/integrase [Cellulosilyticum sp. I15G10I2]|uniref:tyrosine-type recombinase/integrase n=1 Tax=Cellulosilyticum sp. I15G10I2 TaxID=1892843 RepID=UPI00085BD2F6|nr:tyrosine-type recombinase/integrase [Cellulosilyticum sp. I15G10I2]
MTTKRKIEIKGNKARTLKDAREEFMNYNRVRRLAEATMSMYEENLNHFFTIIPSDTLCKEFTYNQVQEYLMVLNDRYTNVITITTRIKATRTFINFCIGKEYIKNVKIELPKKPEIIKETYSDADLRKLLKKPDRNSFNQWKSWMIANFLLGTGCRVRTAINIQIKDLDIDNQLIYYRETKNKRQTIIPMSSMLKSSLEDYLSLWDNTPDDYLFPNYRGEQMSADAFKRNVQRYNNSRGVTNTSSHSYRHTFAKNWILNGGDIFRLQKILSHSTMDMVRKYVNMYSSDLQIGFDNFNPLDNISGVKDKIKINR